MCWQKVAKDVTPSGENNLRQLQLYANGNIEPQGVSGSAQRSHGIA